MLPVSDQAFVVHPRSLASRTSIRHAQYKDVNSGIVAAETVLEISLEQPLSQEGSVHTEADGGEYAFMFPFIQGIVAFDTPYLGISPGVVAHGAEGHYKTASTAYTQLSGLVGGIWGNSNRGTTSARKGATSDANKKPVLALPAAPSTTLSGNILMDGSPRTQERLKDAAAATTASGWQSWSRVAMYAGAAGAVAAGVRRPHILKGIRSPRGGPGSAVISNSWDVWQEGKNCD